MPGPRRRWICGRRPINWVLQNATDAWADVEATRERSRVHSRLRRQVHSSDRTGRTQPTAWVWVRVPGAKRMPGGPSYLRWPTSVWKPRPAPRSGRASGSVRRVAGFRKTRQDERDLSLRSAAPVEQQALSAVRLGGDPMTVPAALTCCRSAAIARDLAGLPRRSPPQQGAALSRRPSRRSSRSCAESLTIATALACGRVDDRGGHVATGSERRPCTFGFGAGSLIACPFRHRRAPESERAAAAHRRLRHTRDRSRLDDPAHRPPRPAPSEPLVDRLRTTPHRGATTKSSRLWIAALDRAMFVPTPQRVVVERRRHAS
jgi:hypothetical protein